MILGVIKAGESESKVRIIVGLLDFEIQEVATITSINTLVGHSQRITRHKSRRRWNWWTYRLSGDRETHHGHTEISGDHQLIIELKIGPVEWSDHTPI